MRSVAEPLLAARAPTMAPVGPGGAGACVGACVGACAGAGVGAGAAKCAFMHLTATRAGDLRLNGPWTG